MISASKGSVHLSFAYIKFFFNLFPAPLLHSSYLPVAGFLAHLPSQYQTPIPSTKHQLTLPPTTTKKGKKNPTKPKTNKQTATHRKPHNLSHKPKRMLPTVKFCLPREGTGRQRKAACGGVGVPVLGGLPGGFAPRLSAGPPHPAPAPRSAAGRGPPRSRPGLSAQAEQPWHGTPTSTEIWG